MVSVVAQKSWCRKVAAVMMEDGGGGGGIDQHVRPQCGEKSPALVKLGRCTQTTRELGTVNLLTP